LTEPSEPDGDLRIVESSNVDPAIIDPRIRARRIEVRRRAGRRRLNRLIAIGVVVTVVVVAVAVIRSPLLDVDRIEVVGADLTGRDAVLAASGVRLGSRMAGVPLGAVAARVQRLPWVATVKVGRSWPGTVRITIAERVAVAGVPAVGGGFVILDATGWEAGVAPDLPGWILRLEVEPVVPNLGTSVLSTLKPLVAVAASVPSAMNGRLLALRLQAGGSAADVPGVEVEGTVRLPDGSKATVQLGPPDQLARKWLAVLTVLDQVDLVRVEKIDVRVPNAPAITRR
jgi:cell division protein FtsQ